MSELIPVCSYPLVYLFISWLFMYIIKVILSTISRILVTIKIGYFSFSKTSKTLLLCLGSTWIFIMNISRLCNFIWGKDWQGVKFCKFNKKKKKRGWGGGGEHVCHAPDTLSFQVIFQSSVQTIIEMNWNEHIHNDYTMWNILWRGVSENFLTFKSWLLSHSVVKRVANCIKKLTTLSYDLFPVGMPLTLLTFLIII